MPTSIYLLMGVYLPKSWSRLISSYDSLVICEAVSKQVQVAFSLLADSLAVPSFRCEVLSTQHPRGFFDPGPGIENLWMLWPRVTLGVLISFDVRFSDRPAVIQLLNPYLPESTHVEIPYIEVK